MHLGAAGVRHDGAGRDGDAGDERKDEWLKVDADVLPVGEGHRIDDHVYASSVGALTFPDISPGSRCPFW